MITVTDWVDADAQEYVKANTLSWMGGWFTGAEGHTWTTYLENFKPEVHPYLEAVRKEVVENKLRLTGEQHQKMWGAPLFSDGKILSLSWRAWGDLMAAIWTEEEKKPYNYMHFYM